MDKGTKQIFALSAIAVAIYLAVKPINKLFETFGINKSEGEKAYLTEQTTGSPFSPNYWRNYRLTHGANTQILTTTGANYLANIIYNSIGYLGNDFQKIFGALKQLKYKTQLSFLAEIFQKRYNADLLTYLRNAKSNMLIHNALTDDQINQVVNFVNTLK